MADERHRSCRYDQAVARPPLHQVVSFWTIACLLGFLGPEAPGIYRAQATAHAQWVPGRHPVFHPACASASAEVRESLKPHGPHPGPHRAAGARGELLVTCARAVLGLHPHRRCAVGGGAAAAGSVADRDGAGGVLRSRGGNRHVRRLAADPCHGRRLCPFTAPLLLWLAPHCDARRRAGLRTASTCSRSDGYVAALIGVPWGLAQTLRWLAPKLVNANDLWWNPMAVLSSCSPGVHLDRLRAIRERLARLVIQRQMLDAACAGHSHDLRLLSLVLGRLGERACCCGPRRRSRSAAANCGSTTASRWRWRYQCYPGNDARMILPRCSCSVPMHHAASSGLAGGILAGSRCRDQPGDSSTGEFGP